MVEMEKIDKVKQGKRNRAKGARFELKVRNDLEEKGWIVDRWTNNVEEGRLVKAKSNRFRMRTMGFPDLIALKQMPTHEATSAPFQVVLIECKVNGYLTKEEKEKCAWLKTNIFYDIFIASEGEKPDEIIYDKF